MQPTIVPEPISRRRLLQRLGGGLGTVGLASLLAEAGLLGADATPPVGPLAPKPPHFKPRAKRIIQLFMEGGPSQVDTFDPKPALEKLDGTHHVVAGKAVTDHLLMKSPYKFQKHGQSGIEVSELFPRVGACVDDMCVVRSMHTDVPDHDRAVLLMTCGGIQLIRPSMGSWLVYGLGTQNQNLPGFVVLYPGNPSGAKYWSSTFLPGTFRGTPIDSSRNDPKTALEHLTNDYLPRSAQREQLDLLNQLNGLHLQQRGGQDDPLESRIESLELAFRMQFEAREVFDLDKETKATRELYGPGVFANGCLTARRLIESGVRMVQVFQKGWDDHNDIRGHAQKAEASDRPIAALLKDLKARGMLDDTLVIWGGEFGRRPWRQKGGRDHNITGFSVWLAGGGVKGGMVYGATDELGYEAVESRMHVHDLHATILHLMGLDHEKLTYRYSGRDFRLTDVSGVVAKGILA